MAGYNPASTVTSNLPQASQVIHYDKEFVANLKANTPFLRCAERRALPKNSGVQHRLYMYNTFAANTAQVSEGTVGSGITPTVNSSTATIGQYADYVSFSDLALESAIDPALENIEKELAYRLALSINQIVRNTADSANSTDSKVSTLSKAANVPLARTDITAAAMSLGGQNVQPFEKGSNMYCGVIHPFAVGDVLNDPANNSLVDILKHNTKGMDRLEELPGEDEVGVLEFSGVRFYRSTTVTQTASYSTSGKTALRSYVFGENAVIAISLGVKEDSQIGEGDWRNLKLWIMRPEEPSISDPSRVIGGFTSYNVKFTSTLPPDSTMRLRYIDANTNVT